MKRALVICGIVIVTVLAGDASLYAQTPAPAPAPAAAPAANNKTPPFKKEELEAIVAPIALYPDALLAQIFMASTYPLEIVEAARWSKTWDPSVKSLCAFPTVLANMNDKIDWTQKLGDAFLAQQKEVMQAVQILRGKAKETGNLKSTKEVTVKEEPAPAGSPAPQTIIIESPNPEVVYVPSYNPTVVYGAWSYPYYPPYAYYPPAYYGGAMFWSFTAGVVVGGAIWGNCNWGGNDVDIDINRQNNFNRNEINANRNNVNSGNRTGNTNRAGNNSAGTKQSWQHNSEHRKGVGYKDSATQQKYNRGGNQQNVAAREQYRGRAEQGREQISREGVGNQRDLSGNQVGTRDSTGSRNSASTRDSTGSRNSASTRDMGGSSSRNSASSRDFGGSSRSSSNAFGGAGRSGASTRSASSRGGMSRGGGGGRRR
jgi:uncharacterized membrane protein YgcG